MDRFGLDAYLQRQREQVVQAFNAPAAHPVGVRSPAQTTTIGGRWQWDPAVPRQQAFVRHGQAGHAEYWVHVDFDGYRAAFLAWLAAEHAIAGTVPTQLHVDHVLNRAFARRHGIFYVRMALLRGAYNTAHGRTLERALTHLAANSKSQYLIDFFMLMKLLGVDPPLNAADYRLRRERIVQEMLDAGVTGPRAALLQGLDGTFELWRVLRA